MYYDCLMFSNTSLLRFLGFSLATGLLALMLSGCGGGGGDGTVRALTKAQYIKQADGICSRADEAQQILLAGYVKKHPEAQKSPSGQEAAIIAALPPDRAGMEEIRSLTPPAADEQEADSLLDEMEAALGQLEEEPALALNPGEAPFQSANRRAEEYGYKVCNRLP